MTPFYIPPDATTPRLLVLADAFSCYKCKQVKPADAFPSSSGRVRSLCRACQTAYSRAWSRQRVHGITPEQYDAMLAQQGGGCAICGSTWAGKPTSKHVEVMSFAVDHDHVTGRIRALLCTPCNTALGKFHDQPELLEQAAAYLRAYE